MTHFATFARLLAILLGVTFIEKLVFAGFHEDLYAGLGLGEVGHALLVGLRFDLAIAAIFAFFAVLGAHLSRRLLRLSFDRSARALAYVAVAALVFIHGADLLYFEESGRHMGYELKEAFNSGTELAAAAVSSYFGPVSFQLLLMAALLWLTHRVLPVRPDTQPPGNTKRWLCHLLPEFRLVAVLALAAVMARGGFQSVPLEPLHAQEIGHPGKAALALNGAYNAVFSSVTPYSIERVMREKPNAEDYALVRELLAPLPAAENKSGSARPNVVIVFLESWSAIRMSSYGAVRLTTPQFDALREQAFTTRDMLAGGHRTTEGLFATLCSAQNPLGATVAQSQLQNYRYDCLPKILREQGYHTAFFQGTVSGTSGTGAFAQLLGFELSFGKEHAGPGRLPHNNWGMHDPDLYQFSLDRMAGLPQPFLVGINTNSTHDSLLPEGEMPTFEEDAPTVRYDNILHFADAAFGEFVTELYARYPDTVLVALADHTGPGGAQPISRYRIPFLIKAPGRKPARLEVTASQRDVAPTLLAMLGLPPVGWFSGRSLMDSADDAHFADYYAAGLLGWTEGPDGIEFPVRRPEDMHCFDSATLAAKNCDEHRVAQRAHALAFTRVMQEALFAGRLRELAGYRPGASQ